MDIYVTYVLNLLSNGLMSEKALKKNLARKFSLTDSYSAEIINKMVENKVIESEFDEDFQNMYFITQTGDTLLNEQEDENLNIDYKSLLGEMCENNSKDIEIEQEDDLIAENDDNDEQNIPLQENEISIDDENTEESQTPYLKDFSQFKINVKKFNKNVKYEPKSNAYLKTTKLELITSLLIFFVFSAFLGGTYLILNSKGFLDDSLHFKFLLFFLISCLYPLITFVLFIFKSNKKEKNIFKFQSSFRLILLTVCVALTLTLALNFLFGLDPTKWLKFLPFWFFPIILGVCAILYPVIKCLLIKSNKFNA